MSLVMRYSAILSSFHFNLFESELYRCSILSLDFDCTQSDRQLSTHLSPLSKCGRPYSLLSEPELVLGDESKLGGK